MGTRLSSWDAVRLRDALRGDGLALDLGAARVRIRSDRPALAPALQRVYAAFEPEPPGGVFDATIALRGACGVRRWLRPQIELVVDGERLFEPFPEANHLPMLEWGLNYLIATRCNQHLLLHAGVVERNGVAIVLPALPGSGKSTLTAALACSGYRLLSDEFGVLDLRSGLLRPLLRPIGLKNESIELLRSWAPPSALGPVFERTRKGRVAHLATAVESYARRLQPAPPALIVFPRFEAGARPSLTPVSAARAFVKLSVNAFNYRLLGARGFDAVAALVARCTARQLVFGDMRQAVALVDALVAAVDERAGGRSAAPERHEVTA